MLGYDYSHCLADGTERRQHPDADTGTELQKAYSKGYIYNGSPWRFGCAKPSDIYIWECPATIGWLEANGYCVWAFDVPTEKVLRGTRQVAFILADATHVEKLGHAKLRRRAGKA